MPVNTIHYQSKLTLPSIHPFQSPFCCPLASVWAVMEQVGLAAIDAGAMRLAASIVVAVKSQFPVSRRAARLVVVFLEAVGEAEGADAEVDAGLATAPDAALLLKRRVAGFKTAGKAGEALDSLREYCDTFQADGDAWGELREGFTGAGRPAAAAFCAEEGVLHAPACAATHTAAGEAHYTAGAVVAAARHFEAAIALSGGEDVRALYGVCCCSAAAGGGGGGGSSSSGKKKGGGGGEVAAGGEAPPDPVPGLAMKMLLQKYREEAPPGLVPFLEAALAGMVER